jgi:large subunit ribosomal protein L6
MSRVGKKPIAIPKGVEVKLEGRTLTVKGPKGVLSRSIHPKVNVQVQDQELTVTIDGTSKDLRSLHGLHRALIANMVTGVTKGFERVLEIVGVGFKADLSGKTAVLNVGYSHPVNFPLPEGIEAKIEKTRISLTGIDRELLGLTASKLRGIKSPEPYKGKGIKYAAEFIRRKAGKAGKK